MPPEPGPARLVSADLDMVGGRIPICSEVESLGKAGQTGFLDSKSVLGKSLGPYIFFIDPWTPGAGAAPSSIPKWETESYHTHVIHILVHVHMCVPW